MNHPTLGQCIVELDDTRTKLIDFIETGIPDEDESARIKSAFDLINQAILAIPHVRVSNGELEWSEDAEHTFTAVGRRGKYTVRQRKDGVWHLFGTVPISERHSLHMTPDAAKNYANEVDHK